MVLTDESRAERVPVTVSAGCGLYRDGEKSDGLVGSARASLDCARGAVPRIGRCGLDLDRRRLASRRGA